MTDNSEDQEPSPAGLRGDERPQEPGALRPAPLLLRGAEPRARQGYQEEAEACCRNALSLKPGYVEAHTNLGNVLRDQGKLTEAEACYREALRLKPGYVEALSNLGAVLADQGKLTEAEACCR